MTGTYPLPEAQLDRFFARISLGYPDKDAERNVLSAQQLAVPVNELSSVTTLEELSAQQQAVREVFVHDTVKDYVVDVVRATRSSNQLVLGASPRATLHLMRAAQAKAAIAGRNSVLPEDVKAVAPYILGHRVLPRAEVRAKGIDSYELINTMLESVTTPLPIS
jgi:MoxR-like ATPase